MQSKDASLDAPQPQDCLIAAACLSAQAADQSVHDSKDHRICHSFTPSPHLQALTANFSGITHPLFQLQQHHQHAPQRMLPLHQQLCLLPPCLQSPAASLGAPEGLCQLLIAICSVAQGDCSCPPGSQDAFDSMSFSKADGAVPLYIHDSKDNMMGGH